MKEEFLPKGYASLPVEKRQALLDASVASIGLDSTFARFSEIARYQNKGKYANVFSRDLYTLMQNLKPKNCGTKQFYSRLTAKCINDTPSNRRLQTERLNALAEMFGKLNMIDEEEQAKSPPKKTVHVTAATPPKSAKNKSGNEKTEVSKKESNMNVKEVIGALNGLAEQRTETIGRAWSNIKTKIDEDFYLVLPTCKNDDDWAYIHCKAGTPVKAMVAKITAFYDVLHKLQDDDFLDHFAIAKFVDYTKLVATRSPFTLADLPAIGIQLEG